MTNEKFKKLANLFMDTFFDKERQNISIDSIREDNGEQSSFSVVFPNGLNLSLHVVDDSNVATVSAFFYVEEEKRNITKKVMDELNEELSRENTKFEKVEETKVLPGLLLTLETSLDKVDAKLLESLYQYLSKPNGFIKKLQKLARD